MGGDTGKKGILRRWWFWVIAVALLAIIVNGLSGGNDGSPGTGADNDQNTQAQAEDQTESAGDTNTGGEAKNAQPEATTAGDEIKEGMYKIGTDLPAGEYILLSKSALPAYFQVSSDSSGSLESIISNDNFNGSRYITVSDGQYLELRGSGGYTADKAPSLVPADGTYNEGMYKTGKDIPPGEYKLIPDGGSINSYVEVTEDSAGTLDSIVSNDNFTAEKYITISDGQYIKLVGCHINTK